jgi:hypothetical protein
VRELVLRYVEENPGTLVLPHRLVGEASTINGEMSPELTVGLSLMGRLIR